MNKGGIGHRIRKLRKLLGLSQKEFAKSLGIHPMTLSRYELGKIQPTEKVLRLMALRFEVNLDWLKKGEGEPFFEERGRGSPKWAIFSREINEELESLAKKIVIGHLEGLCSDEELKKLPKGVVLLLHTITTRHLKSCYTSLSFTLEDFIKWSLGTHPFQKEDNKDENIQMQMGALKENGSPESPKPSEDEGSFGEAKSS